MKIAVLTATRAEYGILKPVLSAIQSRADMDLCLIAGGTHYLESFGNTYNQIEADGYSVTERLDFLINGADKPIDIAISTGKMTELMAGALERQKPDALVILGDRYELLGAATAALLMNIPIVHLFGGEATFGAVDEQIRHALTKMAHIHCTPAEETAARIRQMGEEARRVIVTGHPALDALPLMQLPTRKELETTLGGQFKSKLYVVTFHPETLGENTADDLQEVLGALSDIGQDATFLITHPNADTGYASVVSRLEAFVKTMPDARLFKSLGQARYYGALKIATAVIGNSSSGLLEAPSFGIPTINIGSRQEGRIRASSVIDVKADRSAITAAIRDALMHDYTRTLNPYYKAGAINHIVDAIALAGTIPNILIKTFVDA